MSSYKWNLVGILNEITELINVIFEVEDIVVKEQLISFLEDYYYLMKVRQNLDDTEEDKRILKEIRKKTRIYNTLRRIYVSKATRKPIEEYPIFQYKDTIIRILVRILEIDSYRKIDCGLLSDTTYDEIVDSVLEFLDSIDTNYKDSMLECLENATFEIRKISKDKNVYGQSVVIQDSNYIYIYDSNKNPNYSLGVVAAHESGHIIHDSSNRNVKLIISEVISMTMEIMYIDSLPDELYEDKIVLKKKFASDYIAYMEQLLTQLFLKDNISGIQDDLDVIYKKPLINKRILRSNGFNPHLCYINGEFYQGEAYSIGFLTALRIKEIYDEDKKSGVDILKRIIRLDCSEEEILIFLEQLGIFDNEFISRVRNFIEESVKNYKKIKE